MEIQLQEKSNERTDKKVIATYVNTEAYEKLKREADEDFMSISNLIRKIIYLHLKDNA